MFCLLIGRDHDNARIDTGLAPVAYTGFPRLLCRRFELSPPLPHSLPAKLIFLQPGIVAVQRNHEVQKIFQRH